MTPALGEACRKAIHVVRADGDILRAGKASLYILRGVGYRRTAWLLSWPPLCWLVDLGYAIVSRNRRLFGRFLFTKE